MIVSKKAHEPGLLVKKCVTHKMFTHYLHIQLQDEGLIQECTLNFLISWVKQKNPEEGGLIVRR